LNGTVLLGTERPTEHPANQTALGKNARDGLEDSISKDGTEELRSESESGFETKVNVGCADDSTKTAANEDGANRQLVVFLACWGGMSETVEATEEREKDRPVHLAAAEVLVDLLLSVDEGGDSGLLCLFLELDGPVRVMMSPTKLRRALLDGRRHLYRRGGKSA
jgi:hypothetical protein